MCVLITYLMQLYLAIQLVHHLTIPGHTLSTENMCILIDVNTVYYPMISKRINLRNSFIEIICSWYNRPFLSILSLYSLILPFIIPNTDNPILLNNQMHRVWFIHTWSVLLSRWIWCYIHHIYYYTWSLQAKQQIPRKWLVTYINISRAIKRTFIFMTFFRTIIHSFYIFPPFFRCITFSEGLPIYYFPSTHLKCLWSM